MQDQYFIVYLYMIVGEVKYIASDSATTCHVLILIHPGKHCIYVFLHQWLSVVRHEILVRVQHLQVTLK